MLVAWGEEGGSRVQLDVHDPRLDTLGGLSVVPGGDGVGDYLVEPVLDPRHDGAVEQPAEQEVSVVGEQVPLAGR
jgi:hypothetical protein